MRLFYLLAVTCILTGCGKSIKDVAGVYESAEIKEVIKGTASAYYSTTWVLDLAERGTFTLKEHKSRKHMQSQKYAPVPMDGREISGEWELGRDSIICSWSEFHVPVSDLATDPAPGYRGGDVHYGLTFDVQAAGGIVSRGIDGGTLIEHGGFKPVLVSSLDEIAQTRFKRVE